MASSTNRRQEGSPGPSIGKFYSPELTTKKKPGHIVLDGNRTFRIAEDGSHVPYSRNS